MISHPLGSGTRIPTGYPRCLLFRRRRLIISAKVNVPIKMQNISPLSLPLGSPNGERRGDPPNPSSSPPPPPKAVSPSLSPKSISPPRHPITDPAITLGTSARPGRVAKEGEEPTGRLHLGAIFLDGPSPSCVAGNRRCRAISPHVLVSFAKRCNQQSGFTVACSVSSPPPARAERRPSRGRIVHFIPSFIADCPSSVRPPVRAPRSPNLQFRCHVRITRPKAVETDRRCARAAAAEMRNWTVGRRPRPRLTLWRIHLAITADGLGTRRRPRKGGSIGKVQRQKKKEKQADSS